MEAPPQPKTFPALKLALCGEGDATFSWWVPLLLQSPAFDVLVVWSRHKAEALRLHAALMQSSSAKGAEAARSAAGGAEATGIEGRGPAARSTAANGVAPVGVVGPTPVAAGGRQEQEDVDVYWEESGDISDIGSKNSKKPTRKNFSMLLHQQSTRIDGFFLVLPPDAHKATAEQILSLLPEKHIFSATPPSLHSPTLRDLICQYTMNKKANAAGQRLSDAAATQKLTGSNGNNNRSKNSYSSSRMTTSSSGSRVRDGATSTSGVSTVTKRRRGIWSVCCPFRYEIAVTKLQALLKDLGKIVAAELLASAAIQSVAHTYTGALPQKQMPQQQQRASLLAVCCAYSSLLRVLLGDVVSLASIQGSNSTVSGQLQFHGGVSCSITIDLSSRVTLFSLTIWGAKGFGKLSWNQERNAFEIQRYLHHYEHPTLHPVTGPTWAVKTWVENVWRQDRRERDVHAAVEDKEPDKGDEESAGDRGGEEEEDMQAPERYLIDLLTSCALTDASGAVVQLRPMQRSWGHQTRQLN